MAASCRYRVSLMMSTPQSRWTCCASLLSEPIGTACPLHPPATPASQHVSDFSCLLPCMYVQEGSDASVALQYLNPAWILLAFYLIRAFLKKWMGSSVFVCSLMLFSPCSSRPCTARSSPVSCCDDCNEEPGLHCLEPRDPDQQLPSNFKLRRPPTFTHKVLIYATLFVFLFPHLWSLFWQQHFNSRSWTSVTNNVSNDSVVFKYAMSVLQRAGTQIRGMEFSLSFTAAVTFQHIL